MNSARPILPPLPDWALDLAAQHHAERMRGMTSPLPIGNTPDVTGGSIHGGDYGSIRNTPRMATEAQLRYLANLVTKVDPLVGQTATEWVADHLGAGTFTRDMASNAITRLKEHADAFRASTPTPATPGAHGASQALSQGLPDATTVPAGRYAVEVDGQVKFYRVDRPTQGTYAGRVFVKVQASDEMHRLPWPIQVATLHAIAGVGAKAAAIRYGQELGRCGVCNRTLTDAESIAAGIGPVCLAKFGGM